MADRIYVASNFVKQSILNDFPYKLHADIEVIPYGFPPVNRQRKFNLIGERKLKFLYVGRLSQSKGLSYLFEAIESFREEIDFTIVGSGSLNECQLLKNEIKKYKYIPSLPHDKVLRLMSKNDVFIFPSLFEGFGEAALIDVLPGAVASLAMTIIAFVLLIIVLTIVVIIIRRLVERLMSFALLGGINRVLGFVIGLAEAYLIISILLTVVAYLPSEGFMSAIYQQIDASTITKFLVEHNWIGNWLLTTIF